MADFAEVALSPALKAARTRASFLRKVELLEDWASAGSGDEVWFPKTLADFAAWDDQALGVTAWRKANIVVDPRYSDLRQRYDEAIKCLLQRVRRPVRGGDEVRRRAAAERSAVAIAQQLVAERFAHNATLKELRLARATISMPPARTDRAGLRLVED